MKSFTKFFTLAFMLIIFLWACESEEDLSSESTTSSIVLDDSLYTKALTNYADSLVIPSLERYKIAVTELRSSVSTFKGDLIKENLDDVIDKYKTAYKEFQHVAIHNFEAISAKSFTETHNIFKIDTSVAYDFINDQSFNFTDLDGSDSRENASGFPIMDYMFFGNGDALTYFQNVGAKEITFLDTLTGFMKTTAEELKSEWESNRSTYVANIGTAKSTSLSTHINGVLLWYEQNIRNRKVGFIVGRFSSNSTTSVDPNALEALFESISNSNDEAFAIELLKESLTAFENFYLGKSRNGVDGYGFDDMLKDGGRTSIDNEVKSQFTTIENTIDSRGKISGDGILYEEIQDMVIIWKTDFFGAFNFVDNDGISDND